MDHYEKKVNDLIRKYTQHDEHSTEKGSIFLSFD